MRVDRIDPDGRLAETDESIPHERVPRIPGNTHSPICPLSTSEEYHRLIVLDVPVCSNSHTRGDVSLACGGPNFTTQIDGIDIH